MLHFCKIENGKVMKFVDRQKEHRGKKENNTKHIV